MPRLILCYECARIFIEAGRGIEEKTVATSARIGVLIVLEIFSMQYSDSLHGHRMSQNTLRHRQMPWQDPFQNVAARSGSYLGCGFTKSFSKARPHLSV